jgi:hypothetical protein
MADAPAAVKALDDALTTFEKECGSDPACQRMMPLVEQLDREIDKAYPGGEEPEPRTLREAGRRARRRFAQDRAQGQSMPMASAPAPK